MPRVTSDRDDGAFHRTHLVVARAPDETLIARSQVLLDFKGVESIGPAFADEIFRVFRSTHPSVHLGVINANDEVQKMIRRAEGAAIG